MIDWLIDWSTNLPRPGSRQAPWSRLPSVDGRRARPGTGAPAAPARHSRPPQTYRHICVEEWGEGRNEEEREWKWRKLHKTNRCKCRLSVPCVAPCASAPTVWLQPVVSTRSECAIYKWINQSMNWLVVLIDSLH